MNKQGKTLRLIESLRKMRLSELQMGGTKLPNLDHSQVPSLHNSREEQAHPFLYHLMPLEMLNSQPMVLCEPSLALQATRLSSTILMGTTLLSAARFLYHILVYLVFIVSQLRSINPMMSINNQHISRLLTMELFFICNLMVYPFN